MEKLGAVGRYKWLVFFAVLALIIRLIAAPFGTLEKPDMNNFQAWSAQLSEKGLHGFYDEGWSDAWPGYLYVLWFLGPVKHFFVSFPAVLFKLPAIVADIVAGILVFAAVSRFNKKAALPSAVFYLLNPAVIANSALWGQIDGIAAMFILAVLFFASEWPIVSAALLGVGVLFKWYVLLILPCAVLIWLRDAGWRKMLACVVVTAAVIVGGFVPFAAKPVFSFLLERAGTTLQQYQFTSANAFNLWALWGMWKPDAGWPVVAGVLLAVVLMAAVLIGLWKLDSEPARFLAAALLLFGSFLVLTRMHEHNLLPVLAPLLVAAAGLPGLWISYGLVSATYLANIRFAFVWITQEFRLIFPSWVIGLFSVVNIVVFCSAVCALFGKKRIWPQFAGLKSKMSAAVPVDSSFVAKRWRLLLVVLLVFALVARLYGLSYPNELYFDEVYHAFTARELYRGNTAAWSWESTPPKGFAYAWDHPPLPKLIMAASMRVFGEGPIGWRLPGALLGVGSALLLFLVGVKLFKSRTVALLGTAFFVLDGLPLVLSRIGMNDVYFMFFALGAIYFLLSERYFLSALFLGLAGASKWTAVWLVPVLVALWLIFWKRPTINLAWFLVVPPAVYLLSYAPFFLAGYTAAQFVELQRQMFWYHTHLNATHPFSSPWWSWPLMLKPVWLFTQSSGNLVSNIYAQGNPVIFWVGFACVLVAVLFGIVTRRREVWAALAAYVGFFVPWSLSPRIMFIYHYLPSVPFLCLLLAYMVSCSRRRKLLSLVLLSAALLLFLYLYPRWVGIPMPAASAGWYAWLPS